MAVNKNFVVKNGLEVNTDLLFADSATRAVGVGSTSPNFDLDVRGGIGATDLRVTGFTTLTKDLQVGASGSAFYVSNTNNLVGVGTSVPAFLMDIRSSVSSGQTALYVQGDARITGDINLDDLTIDDLTVTGIATYKPDGSGGTPDSWIDIDYTGNTVTGGGTTIGIGSTAYFVDNAKAVFGASEDLEIYHLTGNTSHIHHKNTSGNLRIRSGGTIIANSADDEIIAQFLDDREGVKLYNDGNIKFAVTPAGVTVAGGSSITGISTVQSTAQNQFNATTGALQVAGGAGIAKNLHVGGGASITGITSIYVSDDSYAAMIENPHANGDGLRVRAGDADDHRPFLVEDKGSVNLFAVYGGGGVDINVGVVTARNTTQSSSSTNGAFQIKGGASVSKNLFVGGGAEVTGVTTITGTLDANGALDVDGHTELDDVNVAGASTFAGAIDANATTQSSSSTTGAATFAGGVGVAKQLYVGAGASVGAGFTIGTGIGVTTILDDDAFNNASATALASQQSIKAYVDTQITAEDLDFSGDSGTGAVDLDSQTLAISGTASEIKTVASGQSLTISLPDDVIVGNGFTVTGIGSFLNDVNFRGKSGLTSAFWDKSESTLKWNDNAVASFGDSGDLKIYHDKDGQSRIEESGSSVLKIMGSDLRLSNAANSADYIQANDGGAVNLFFGGTKKFETGPAGVIVTGIATASGFRAADGVSNGVKIGDGEDLIIQHNGTNSFIDNNTGDLYIQTTGSGDDIFVEAADDFQVSVNSKTGILAIGDAEVQLYYNNAKKFETTNDGTVTTGIGTFSGIKIPNGNATNDDNIRIGNGSELQLWHNGTYSAIQADDLKIVDKANGHGMITAEADGAVGLRYDNVEKFATTNDGTVTTGISTVDGLRLGDNEYISVGAGSTGDLQLSHNGTDSIINNSTGHLYIRSNTGIDLTNAAGSKTMIEGTNAAEVSLYYDNTKTFETTTYGAKTTGRLAATTSFTGGDSVKLILGDSDDLQIWHDSHNYIKSTNGDLILQAPASNWFYVKTDAGNDNSIIAKNNAGVFLYHNGSAKFETTSSGVSVTGSVSDSLGNLRDIPYNGNTSARTLAAADAGKVIANTSGGWVIPNDVFSTAGNTVTLLNDSGSDQNINASALTYLYNTADGANIKASTIALGARAMATIYFTAATKGYIQSSKITVS